MRSRQGHRFVTSSVVRPSDSERKSIVLASMLVREREILTLALMLALLALM